MPLERGTRRIHRDFPDLGACILDRDELVHVQAPVAEAVVDRDADPRKCLFVDTTREMPWQTDDSLLRQTSVL